MSLERYLRCPGMSRGQVHVAKCAVEAWTVWGFWAPTCDIATPSLCHRTSSDLGQWTGTSACCGQPEEHDWLTYRQCSTLDRALVGLCRPRYRSAYLGTGPAPGGISMRVNMREHGALRYVVNMHEVLTLTNKSILQVATCSRGKVRRA
jgi:hypothetical protein